MGHFEFRLSLLLEHLLQPSGVTDKVERPHSDVACPDLVAVGFVFWVRPRCELPVLHIRKISWAEKTPPKMNYVE